MDVDLKLLTLLIKALGYCSEKDSDVLLKIINSLMETPLEEGNPKARYLQTLLPNLGQSKPYNDVSAFDKAYNAIILETSVAGIPEAQYQQACRLHERQELVDAVDLYKKSADKGYAPSQYCYGLDRYNGVGIDRDEKEGLEFIELAAGQLDEYALEFLIALYENNKSDQNNLKLQKYKRMLKWL